MEEIRKIRSIRSWTAGYNPLKHLAVSGGFTFVFDVYPRTLRFHDSIWGSHFSDGLVQPPTRMGLESTKSNNFNLGLYLGRTVQRLKSSSTSGFKFKLETPWGAAGKGEWISRIPPLKIAWDKRTSFWVGLFLALILPLWKCHESRQRRTTSAKGSTSLIPTLFI